MLTGKRISGRYKINRMIGGGGMANVYLAHDMILDRDVAVKILRMDFANEEEFIRRFQREAQSATSLTHQNIVSIYDVGEENDVYYIVMEYVDGPTLKQYIQQHHPVTVEKTLDIMKQLTAAVAHAHQNHIIHRDIKPQNILLDHDGNVLITDFGIAMALSATSITQTNAVLGSVHYLSPEQARGGMATKKSDIYSLGIVMFELLTGRLPFSGESAVSIALKHLQSDTPSPTRWNPDLPQSVENIVLKATAKDPFLRYASAEEMERDLETALDHDRLNEPKFFVPEDLDATTTIPVIPVHNSFANIDDTVLLHEKEKNQSDQQNKQKRKKKWPWVVGSTVALLLISILFLTFILPMIKNAQNVNVPDVTGREYDDAVQMLVSEGLEIGEKTPLNDEEIPEGEVIKTSPRAEREVKKGSVINLYISAGKAKFPLSDYRGRQFDEIVQLLDKKGFKDIKQEGRHDDSSIGTILDQNYDPDQEVIPEETVLIFTTSKGPEQISLKSLAEYNEKGLEDYAESTGLHIDMTAEDYSATVPAGLVISQDPAAGTELVKGDTVKVVISKGQKAIPPETVTREITIEYDPVEEGEKQVVKIFIEDATHSMTVPFETFEIEETVENTTAIFG